MPTVRTNDNRVVAVICGDLHLSHTAPVGRAEKGVAWYEVMERYLSELSSIALNANGYANPPVPIFYTGDFFDRWNSPPELINFTLRNLPNGNAIPGNHDLPFHDYQSMSKSAYAVLEAAGKIRTMTDGPNDFDRENRWCAWAFPFGRKLTALPSKYGNIGFKHIAICHKYIWKKGHSFPGSPESAHVNSVVTKLKGFDAAFFGDNHKGFIENFQQPGIPSVVCNCGGFIRRKRDEQDYLPRVALLHNSGKVTLRYLNVGLDQFTEDHHLSIHENISTAELLEYVQGADMHDADFREELVRHIAHLKNPRVRSIILALLEDNPK